MTPFPLWYLFQTIKHYMELCSVNYAGYSFNMWDVSVSVIILFLCAWAINRFLYLMDD